MKYRLLVVFSRVDAGLHSIELNFDSLAAAQHADEMIRKAVAKSMNFSATVIPLWKD